MNSKRGAASPAEGEKSKKPDSKSTPTSPSMGFMGSFKRVLGGGNHPPFEPVLNQSGNMSAFDEDSEGSEENGWQVQTPRRRRRWSTGRTPGNTPPPNE